MPGGTLWKAGLVAHGGNLLDAVRPAFSLIARIPAMYARLPGLVARHELALVALLLHYCAALGYAGRVW
jgi:hypothetical protein